MRKIVSCLHLFAGSEYNISTYARPNPAEDFFSRKGAETQSLFVGMLFLLCASAPLREKIFSTFLFLISYLLSLIFTK